MRHLRKYGCLHQYLEKYEYIELFPESIQNVINKQNEQEFTYQCEFCKKGFNSKYAMGKHLQPKASGPCKILYERKYGSNLSDLPWNRKVKCKKCETMIWPSGKTGLCHHCASVEVVRSRSRNAKITKVKQEFVKDGLVDWRCEFCNVSFEAKGLLESHSRTGECSKKYFDKYRTRNLFPWNNYKGSSNCDKCGVLIQKGPQLCKACSNQWKANYYQLGNPAFEKILDVYRENYTVKFYNKDFRKQILKRQRICPICYESLDSGNLHLHHIDYNKKNDNRDNLIFLHHSCHTKTNWRRSYWKKVLKEFTNRELMA